MKKYVNGKFIDLSEDEILQMEKETKSFLLKERTRPRTIEEGSIELQKVILSQQLENTEDKTLAIACMAFFDMWTPSKYSVGDIRTNPTTGYPYECILEHDSTNNPTWDISVRTLWKPYHSRKKEYALPYEAPTGAHDMYKTGEYMIWTDGEIYECLSDTNYSPIDYAQAWSKIG